MSVAMVMRVCSTFVRVVMRRVNCCAIFVTRTVEICFSKTFVSSSVLNAAIISERRVHRISSSPISTKRRADVVCNAELTSSIHFASNCFVPSSSRISDFVQIWKWWSSGRIHRFIFARRWWRCVWRSWCDRRGVVFKSCRDR